MIKLSLEEQEHVFELLTSDGYRILVQKIIPALNERRKTRVFTHKATGYDSLIELSALKAEVDGADALAADIRTLKETLFKSADSATVKTKDSASLGRKKS